MSSLLVAAAVLLAFAAAWEVLGAIEGRAGPLLAGLLARAAGGTIDDASARLGLPGRIARAGLAGRLEPASVAGAKAAAAAAAALVALIAAPALPGRLVLPAIAFICVAGFLAPDAVLERIARRRRERAVAALPDALDMLAVAAASGRSPAVVFDELARSTVGPLAAELARAAAEIEAGATPRDALGALRDRIPGPEIGALSSAFARSRDLGSPLAEQLHLQATALRHDARRRIEERAAKAAPKIQLVVALVLVPSVLLMILAALIAGSDSLFAPT